MIQKMVEALEARGLTADDLSELVHELAVEGKCDAALIAAANEAASVNQQGLQAQVTWLSRYYQDQPELLGWALSGWMNLPTLKEAA